MYYFDNAATTKMYDEVVDTYVDVNRDYFYNAKSIHEGGRKSANVLEASRQKVLELMNLPTYQCIFTSGATESNNIAIQSILNKKKRFGNVILVSELEHPSVVNVIKNFDKDFTIKFIKTTSEGHVDLEHLNTLLTDDVIFLSVMSVNNIIGSVQPVQDIVKILYNYPKVFFHVDATQAIGKVNCNYEGVDALSISAHKFYGPKGAGALLYKEKGSIGNVFYGGGHEMGIRSGTSNLPAIVAMVKALRITLENLDENNFKISDYNHQLTNAISQHKNVVINPHEIPHILNVSYPGVKGEVIVNAMSERGIYLSTTSACHSKATGLNETLLAIGLPVDLIEGSVRISIGIHNNQDSIDAFIIAFDEVIKKFNEVF